MHRKCAQVFHICSCVQIFVTRYMVSCFQRIHMASTDNWYGHHSLVHTAISACTCCSIGFYVNSPHYHSHTLNYTPAYSHPFCYLYTRTHARAYMPTRMPTHSRAHICSAELEKLLQLDTLEGRTWKIQEAIATENVGLKEGLEWVGSTLPKGGCRCTIM